MFQRHVGTTYVFRPNLFRLQIRYYYNNMPLNNSRDAFVYNIIYDIPNKSAANLIWIKMQLAIINILRGVLSCLQFIVFIALPILYYHYASIILCRYKVFWIFCDKNEGNRVLKSLRPTYYTITTDVVRKKFLIYCAA